MELIKGTRYWVQYQIIGVDRKVKTFIGTYLGDDSWGHAQFDLRPKAGTATLRREAILQAEVTIAPHSLPR